MEFLKLSRLKILNLLIFVLLLNACSLVSPFVDRRREAGAPVETLYRGASTPLEPAVCYNNITTPYQEVQDLANAECQKTDASYIAKPIRQTTFTCRLFTPNHYYFKCIK